MASALTTPAAKDEATKEPDGRAIGTFDCDLVVACLAAPFS
jgi:hypothetical protein